MDGEDVTHQKTARPLLHFLMCRSETSRCSRTTDFVLHSVSQTRPYYRLSSALTSSPIPFLDNPLFRYIMHASPVQVPVRSDVDAMAHAQKPDFVFRAERTSPFKSAERGVSSVDYWQPRCALSAVVMLDTPCSEVV